VTNCTNEWCRHPEDDHVLARGACASQNTDHYGTWKCLCVRYATEEDE
jgi:hypothetical protein